MTQTDAPVQSAQERFDELYISSSEIARELGIARTTLMQARKRGLLPDPIIVNDGQVYLYEREKVRPNIDAWKIMLQVRKHNQL